MKLAVAFTGPSNSGKTTLIVKIAEILIKEKRVAIIKNDPKDKAKFDKEGKDSYKFSQTGADVAVVSLTRTTLFLKKEKSLNDIINFLDDFDILMVEGLKTFPLPRIGVFRDRLDESYFDYCDALAIDNSIDLSKYNIDEKIKILNLNNPLEVISWINDNAKEL